MVFENLTLFEVSLDGAQIGPRSMGRSDEDAAHEEVSGAGGAVRVVPLVVLAVVVGLLMRRRRSRRSVEAVAEDAAELEAAR